MMHSSIQESLQWKRAASRCLAAGSEWTFWHEPYDGAGASSTWVCRMASTRQSASDPEPARSTEACLQVLQLSSVACGEAEAEWQGCVIGNSNHNPRPHLPALPCPNIPGPARWLEQQRAHQTPQPSRLHHHLTSTACAFGLSISKASFLPLHQACPERQRLQLSTPRQPTPRPPLRPEPRISNYRLSVCS